MAEAMEVEVAAEPGAAATEGGVAAVAMATAASAAEATEVVALEAALVDTGAMGASGVARAVEMAR